MYYTISVFQKKTYFFTKFVDIQLDYFLITTQGEAERQVFLFIYLNFSFLLSEEAHTIP